MSSSIRRRSPDLSLLALLVLAFGLRVWNLGAQSLWWDEALSLILATSPTIDIRPGDAGHPPLYDYVFLRPWVALTGVTEFATRYSSVLFGVLAVALAYALARRLYDRRVAWLAAVLVTFSPIQLWYSQELRMYTQITCLTLLLLLLLDTCLEQPWSASWRPWLAVGVVEFLAVYTQYLVAVVVAWVNVVALVHFWRLARRAALDRPGEKWRPLRRWLAAQTVAVGLALPAAAIALDQVTGYVPPNAQPLDPLAFLTQVWGGYMGGALALLGHHALFDRLFPLTVAAAGLATIVLLVTSRTRRRDRLLLSYSLVPLAVIWLVMGLRPGFHPRYVVMLSAPLLVFLARALVGVAGATRGRKGLSLASAGVAVILAGVFLTTALTAYTAAQTDPRYQRDDVRGLTRRLETTVTPQPEDATVAEVADLTRDRRRALLVTWAHGHGDERGLLPWLLDMAGAPSREWDQSQFTVREYRVSRAPMWPAIDATPWGFGPLHLTGWGAATPAVSGAGVHVALRWERVAPLFPRAKVAVHLLDSRGRVIASDDAPLVDADGVSAALWAVGRPVVNVYTLLLPPGSPPLAYTITVTVYDEATGEAVEALDMAGAPTGPSASAGTVQVERAVGRAPADRGLTALNAQLGEHVVLEGVGIEPREDAPGQAVALRLRWQATSDAPQLGWVRVQLVQSGAVIAEAAGDPADGLYPASRWVNGEVVLDRREIIVPANAQAGSAQLQVRVGEGPAVPLGDITLRAPARQLTPPAPQVALDAAFPGVGRLIGYDLARSTMTSTTPLNVTLYWQAEGASDVPLTVFVHLLDPGGRILAQHDAPPANGARPTTGWAPGEYLADPHALVFHVTDYIGAAQMEVGLYNPTTGERVKLGDGSDKVTLPTGVLITR